MNVEAGVEMAWPLEPDDERVEAMGRDVLARIARFAADVTSVPRESHADGLIERMHRPPAEEPGDLTDLLDVFQSAAEQALDTAGPGYLAYFPAGGLFSSAFAELLAQVYNRYTAVADLSPALVAMEHGMVRWFCDRFGLPAGSTGLVTTGGSMATLTAVVAARDDRLGGPSPDGTVYVTTETHFSVARAARITGIPADRVRVVPTRGLRMDPVAAAELIAADRARNLRPFLLVGSAGTTSSGTVDPLGDLAGLARDEGLWFQVDAAYGGGFQLTERGRVRLSGVERADSIALDPHKALFLQYGTGLLLVRDGRTLAAAFADGGDYVQDVGAVDGLPDYGFLGPELTREFRGFRLWLPLHLHGIGAFRAMLDEKLDMAELAYHRLAADPRFEVLAQPDLTVLNFRLRAGEGPTRRLLERINSTGRIFLSSTRITGEFHLRLNASNHRTRPAHLRAALDLITAGAAEVPPQ